MPWLTRGLRDGIVTTGYPRRADGYGASFRARVEVDPGGPSSPADAEALARVVATCPTGAISVGRRGAQLDRGRCILCGRCVAERPEIFSFAEAIETAAEARELLVVPELERGLWEEEALVALRRDLARRARALRRSVHIRHVDTGSDGAEEAEIAALTNPVYDVERLGIYFTASPRHADVLLVTGVGAAGMAGPLRRAHEAMPEPRIVVAVGTDAASGGVFAGAYANRGGVADLVPVDVYVPGSPPSPFSILHGILLALGLVRAGGGTDGR